MEFPEYYRREIENKTKNKSFFVKRTAHNKPQWGES